METFWRRGAKLTVIDAIRLFLIFTAAAVYAYFEQNTFTSGYFFLFTFSVALLLPLFLASGFTKRKTNLKTPYEKRLKALSQLHVYVDVFSVLGFALLLTPFQHRSLLIVALTIGLVIYAGGLLVLFLQEKRKYPSWLKKYLIQSQPEFVLHTPRPDGGSYQVQMWLSPLESLSRNFIIVVRDARALTSLEPITRQPILVCESWRDLDQIMVPNIKTVFYVNSVGANADLLTYRSAKHVYLGHGDSTKPLSIHPLHAAFDYIAVAGQAAIDRYEQAGIPIPNEKFILIGRPQIFQDSDAEDQPFTRSSCLSVIYAPTWSGYNSLSNYSSLKNGPTIVNSLIENGYRVIFRPHPFSLQRPAEKKLCLEVESILQLANDKNDAHHLYGTMVQAPSFPEIMASGDLLVADRSSVIIDFLATGKPIVEIIPPAASLNLDSDELPSYVYELSRDLVNLPDILQEATTSDPKASGRHAAASYYLDPRSEEKGHFKTATSFLFE